MIRNIFLDANVIISVIVNEYPRATYSSKVLSLAQDHRYKLYVSPHTLAICHYFSAKQNGKLRANHVVSVLTSKLHVTNHFSSHVNAVNTDSRINDFEDGLQYFSATEAKCQAIITYNAKDFHFGDLPLFLPKDFLLADAKGRKI